MTNKLFWTDPYLTVLDTKIQTVSGDWVTLVETIFYAFSGGQESDNGFIGGYPVLEARIENYELYYRLPESHSMNQGDEVRVEIDWQKRYRLMRLHFAAELVLELTYRAIPGIEKIGANIAPDKARIDFKWTHNISFLLPQIMSQIQNLVERDFPIISAFSDEIKEIRYWEVPGFARIACGGTHLKKTGEVGNITLRRDNIGKGKERIEVYLV